MNIINYITISIVPLMIIVVLIIGVKEKKNVFDLFNIGVFDGLKIIFNLFPTLLRSIFCY